MFHVAKIWFILRSDKFLGYSAWFCDEWFVEMAKNTYLCTMMDEQTKKLRRDYLRYLRLQRNMSANTLDAFLSGERQKIGEVLLTGATGYLGIHILNELLSRYEGRIWCPIRAENDEKALNRLTSMYFYYFGRT